MPPSLPPQPSEDSSHRERLALCLGRDRARLERRLNGVGDDAERRAAVELEIEASVRAREARVAGLPVPAFPAELPVSERRDEIAAAILAHPVVIVAGETGSGKTTQLPKICLSIGRGVDGWIGHTQPRRIAARSVAARIAQELGTPLGQQVGYKVRFADRVRDESYVKVLTDGMLLAEIQGDRELANYDTLIVDEAHERSLNVDFLLGYLKRLLPRRPDLRLIVTSATLDTARFAEFFGGAPVIEVSGRAHPVELRHRPYLDPDEDSRDRDLTARVLEGVDEVCAQGPGDVLVFLPGEREIRDCAEALRKHHPPGTEILPLYARLSAAEQDRVFQGHARRRIVLATNVAETALTVPGIRYVVDSGYARISRYSPRSKVQLLHVEPIARASAAQRAGRCGRIGPGVCVRLYSEEDFLARPEYTDPEIRRTSLAAVILQMHALRLGAVEDFPFIDPPEPRQVRDGIHTLRELGALAEGGGLTETGRALARLPVDPRIGRMILAAARNGCLAEVLVIAAALSVPDPRDRPQERQARADELHRRFADEQSDFLGLLRLWRFVEAARAEHATQSRMRRFCAENFISYVRLREWEEVHRQLARHAQEMGLRTNAEEADYASIHRALLTGLLGQVGEKGDRHEYTGARGVKFHVFPGSGLFRKPPKWLMAAELVDTGRLWARTVARIEPEWVEQAGAHLVKRSHYEPRWEKRAGQVAAWERVTLYGLTLVNKRRVNFGAIDPPEARRIFIREALVEGELHTRAPFFAHNRKLVGEVEALGQRARRSDLVADPETLFRFYDERIPEQIHSAAAFEKWRADAERRDPRCLYLARAQLATRGAEGVTRERYPARLELPSGAYALGYRFEPGAADDGVTLTVPAAALSSLEAEALEWLVPGMLEEKLGWLIRALPGALRKNFVPVPDFVRALQESLVPYEGALLPAMEETLDRLAGVAVPRAAWKLGDMPAHLRMNLRVVDEHGRTLGEGRDLEALRAGLRAESGAAFRRAGAWDIERTGLRSWDCDDLPDAVEADASGHRVVGHPALVDEGESVAVRVFEDAAAAIAAHRAGLRRLFMLGLAEQVRYLRGRLPGMQDLCLQFAPVGRCEALREDIVGAAIERLFLGAPLPRTKAAFAARREAGRGHLVEEATEIARLVGAVLAAFTPVHRALKGPHPATWRAAVEDLRAQLDGLVHPGFVSATPPDRLGHLPRYLKAMAARLDKLRANPARDGAALGELAPLLKRQREAAAAGTPGAAALDEFRWLIEELRVSLFAQELKTAQPISVKRLEKRWQELLDAAGSG